MNIIRGILSHGFLLIGIGLLALSFYYRADLFPNYFVPQINQASVSGSGSQSDNADITTSNNSDRDMSAISNSENTDILQSQTSPKSLSSDNQSSTVAVIDNVLEEAHDTIISDDANIEPISDANLVNNSAVSVDDAQAENGLAGTGEDTQVHPMELEQQKLLTKAEIQTPVLLTEDSTAKIAEPIDKSAIEENVVEPAGLDMHQSQSLTEEVGGEFSAVSSTDKTIREDDAKLHLEARKAYWSGDREKAEQKYQVLLKTKPSDPNAPGELGNIYFAQGEWNKAADAYFEAASRLVKIGNISYARHLQRVIYGLNMKRGDELEELISQTTIGAVQ